MPLSKLLKINSEAARLAQRARRLEVRWREGRTDRAREMGDYARARSRYQERLKLHRLAMAKIIFECEKLRQMVHEIVNRKVMRKTVLEISERERQRIGRDLHDGLGQHLHGVSFLAALLEKNLREDRSRRTLEARQLKEYILDSLELTRSLAHGLQPVESTPEGLMAGLHELAKRTSKLFRIECRFDCPADVLVQRHGAAIHLYRIAQEALNNAVKHGKPTRICIKLEVETPRIVLRVCDNGVGIRPANRNGHGMGLQIMRYRADALNGLLSMKKQPRGGTEMFCTVPRRSLCSHEKHPL
jgi:signal transduction histidine kinase